MNFKPNYRLTKNLLLNITQIERLYGQLEALNLPKKLELTLQRNNLIQSSYISNSIEGNPLSLPEVTNLLLNDRLPVNREEKEVKNYFEILKNLKVYLPQSFSLDLIKEIHQQLLTGVNREIAGQIRNSRIVVGRYAQTGKKIVLRVKHEPPYHRRDQIQEAVKALLNWEVYDKENPAVIKAGIFHHHFVYLHPFEDGNGRVCRLLTALVFLQQGYLINKYFVLDDYYDIDRFMYSDKLHSADFGDKTEWLEYFSEGVKYSLQSALAKAKNSISLLAVREQPTPREKEVLNLFQEKREMTSTQLAKRLKISRQQAFNLLKALIKRGFLGKRGETKASYYYLK